MRVFNRITTTAATSLALLVLGAGAAGAAGPPSDDMSRAKAATAPYHDVNVALADGFVDEDGECTSSPEGGMGFHFVNFDRFDTVLDAAEPEVLLYAPSEDGLRLVGAEYAVAAPVDQAPQLFGHTLDKVQEIGDGLAIYVTHAWIWRQNPAGSFADYNPKVTC